MPEIEIFSYSPSYNFVPDSDRSDKRTLYYIRQTIMSNYRYWDGENWTAQSVYARPYATPEAAKIAAREIRNRQTEG